MNRAWAAVLLLFPASCDDTVLVPCAKLTPDWHGVQCTLQTHCAACHAETHDNPPVAFTVLPVDITIDVIEGNGLLVVPGDPQASLLWRSLSGDLEPDDAWGVMPWGYRKPLPRSQIDHVREWIELGAELDAGL